MENILQIIITRLNDADIPVAKFREIARTEPWRNYWLSNKYNIFGIPKPDVNLILHVTPEISQQLVDKKGEREYLKGKKRDIHEDDLRHLADAEAAYVQIARSYPEFKLIECVENGQILSPEKIHQMVLAHIQPYL